MVGGVHNRGACVAVVSVWRGPCMVRGVHGGGHV